MKIAIGSDHAGFELKEKLKKYLTDSGILLEDMGTNSPESIDYPDIAERVAAKVRDGAAERGILLCATGVGVCMTANKIHGVRAALAWNHQIAELCRQHNNANILCLPGRFMDFAAAQDVVKTFLETPFESGGRHERRVNKISAIELKDRNSGERTTSSHNAAGYDPQSGSR